MRKHLLLVIIVIGSLLIPISGAAPLQAASAEVVETSASVGAQDVLLSADPVVYRAGQRNIAGGTIAVLGDVDGLGQVNMLDMQACVDHILGRQDWGENADVNEDGSVNVVDVQEIVNTILSNMPPCNSPPHNLAIGYEAVDADFTAATNLPRDEAEASAGTPDPILPVFGGDWIDGGPTPDSVTGLGNMLGAYLGKTYDVGAHESGMGVAWAGVRSHTDLLTYGLPSGWRVAEEGELVSFTDIGAPSSLTNGRLLIVQDAPGEARAFLAADFGQLSGEARWEFYNTLLGSHGGECYLVDPVHFRDGLGAAIVNRGNHIKFVGARVDDEGVLEVTGGAAFGNLMAVRDDMFTFMRSLYYAWNLQEDPMTSPNMDFVTPPASGPEAGNPFTVEVTLTSASVTLNGTGGPVDVQFRRKTSGDTEPWRDAMGLSVVTHDAINTRTGSIFHLAPGTTYEVRVGAEIATFTTRSIPKMQAGGEIIEVWDTGLSQALVAGTDQNSNPTYVYHAGNYGSATFAEGGSEYNPVLHRAYGDGDVSFDSIRIEGSYIWIDGFTAASGFHGGNSATGVTLTRNRTDHAFHSIDSDGTNWLSLDNTLVGDQDGSCSGSECYSGEGIEFDGRGHVAAFNTVSEVGDGFSYGDGHIDVHNNLIHHIVDDFIEPDYSFDNYRMWNNFGYELATNALSLQPINGGPWYYFKNQASGLGSIFKLRTGSGDTYVVSNSLAAAHPSQGIEMIFSGKGMIAGNYFAVKDDAGWGWDHIGYTSGSMPNLLELKLWDYNRYGTSATNLFKLGSTRYSIVDLQNEFGADSNTAMVSPGAPGLQVRYQPGKVINFTGSASDLDEGDTVTLEWFTRIVGGSEGPVQSIGPSFAWTIPADPSGNTYEIILRASDGTATVEEILDVQVLPAN